jgi:hypothetical protein
MAMDLHAVRALIDAAFAGVPRDEDCTLHHAELLDHTLDREIAEEEWIEARRRDPETDWRDVPVAALEECGAALSHATPMSWLFYMPAYMKHALDMLDSDKWFSGSVIFHLTYRRQDSGLHWYALERFKQLTPRREEAVIAFLNYVVAHPGTSKWDTNSATEALNNYWALPAHERPQGLVAAP